MLSASQTGPGTPLSRLKELVLIRNKKKTDGSTASIILSGSPCFMNDAKTIRDFRNTMRQHTMSAFLTVKWASRKNIAADVMSMKKLNAMKEQYDSDLLFAAQ